MGDIFSNSFKRELGKNTAKTVSNLVFGDKWSTPYRRINSDREQRLREMQEAREQRLREKNDAVIASIEAREERERQNHLNKLDEAVLGNIDKLVAVPIPNDVNGLNNYLGMLSVQMKSIKLEKDIQEADIRNKYLFALIERYRQAVDELAYLNPKDRHLPNYINLLIDREFETKKFSKGKLFLVIIFSILLLPSLLTMYEGIDRLRGEEFVIGLIASLINLAVIYFCAIRPKTKLKKARKKELQKYEQLMSCNTEKQEPKNIIQQTQHPEEIHIDNSHSSDDIFFDLNPDNRIGVALARIWSKYRGLVPDEILARRPIFAADGVKDCILFVGINPSFSENDDNNFIENDDKKSLLYGSFYQREDSPQYFKNLEMFAARFGKSYTQMNLLYVRENDRNSVLKMNPDFTREQLELTYETIVRLQPKMIVFFTDYCRKLIYGKDRWVYLDSWDTTHYVLNGTNIPAVFSEDINNLNEEELGNLQENIAFALSQRK